MVRKLKVIVDDIGEKLVLVSRVIRRETNNELIEQCSKTVEVNLETVSFPSLK